MKYLKKDIEKNDSESEKLMQDKEYKYKENNPEYKGNKMEREIKGPVDERKFTDCLFCLFFVMFWLFLIVISVMGFKNGDPVRLASPFDHSGN